MRPIPTFGNPFSMNTEAKLDWCVRTLQEICAASQRDAGAISDSFKVTNLPTANEVRTLDVTAATTADLAKVLGTLLTDMRRRGPRAGTGIG